MPCCIYACATRTVLRTVRAARSYAASASLSSGGTNNPVRISHEAQLQSTATAKENTGSRSRASNVFIKKQDAAGFVMLKSKAIYVAELLEDAANKLRMTEQLSALSMHRVEGADGSDVAGPALDNRKTVEAAGLADGASVMVKVAAPPSVLQLRKWFRSLFAPANLTYRIALKKGTTPPISQSFASEAAFDKFIHGCKLHHMEKAKEKNGADRILQIVTTLADAVDALNVEGTYLLLQDPTAMLREDVNNLQSFGDNLSTAFELQTNKAIATNKQLLDAYGGKLELLNEGRGVTFCKEGSDETFLQCDGLIKNSTVILLNEVKMHLHEDNVLTQLPISISLLEHIRANKKAFYSVPPGVVDQLGTLPFAVIASCKDYTPEAKQVCKERNIPLLVPDGSGFKCELYPARA